MINKDDKVDLVVVFSNNHLFVSMSRELASKTIRGWWQAREDCMTSNQERNEEDKNHHISSLWWLHGTYAGNYVTDDGLDLASSAFAWEHVIGMYISEGESSSERLAAAQEDIAKAMCKSMDPDAGAEWRGEE
ncbi:MAG: hypothetical protein KGL39_00120 [Patescibacteria group bacterium]|nr:hypothetical protein [Patescibacteria group bacterium]